MLLVNPTERTAMSKQETPFEESQRLCRERDKANSQIVQMRKALEVCVASEDQTAAQTAKDSIDTLERSGVW